MYVHDALLSIHDALLLIHDALLSIHDTLLSIHDTLLEWTPLLLDFRSSLLTRHPHSSPFRDHRPLNHPGRKCLTPSPVVSYLTLFHHNHFLLFFILLVIVITFTHVLLFFSITFSPACLVSRASYLAHKTCTPHVSCNNAGSRTIHPGSSLQHRIESRCTSMPVPCMENTLLCTGGGKKSFARRVWKKVILSRRKKHVLSASQRRIGC